MSVENKSGTKNPIDWETRPGPLYAQRCLLNLISSDVQEFCNEMSVRHSRTVPETPQLNAGAERGNGILVRQTRILLAAANLTDKVWPYAFKYICFVHNSLPSRRHSPPISP